MIASIELGVMMKTNLSWSIDDSRNKFQFGCEHGQVIRNGQLAEVVRNPNYRGISATFWRSLAMVGDASTFEVMGTPFCGKGEPSQVIRVGPCGPGLQVQQRGRVRWRSLMPVFTCTRHHASPSPATSRPWPTRSPRPPPAPTASPCC